MVPSLSKKRKGYINSHKRQVTIGNAQQTKLQPRQYSTQQTRYKSKSNFAGVRGKYLLAKPKNKDHVSCLNLAPRFPWCFACSLCLKEWESPEFFQSLKKALEFFKSQSPHGGDSQKSDFFDRLYSKEEGAWNFSKSQSLYRIEETVRRVTPQAVFRGGSLEFFHVPGHL